MDERQDEELSFHMGEAREFWLAQYTEVELPPHVFSARFERTMASLIRKQKRSPAMRRTFTFAKRAAVLLLVLLLCGGLFLAMDTEARAMVPHWFRETFSHSVLYRFAETQKEAPLPVYSLGWVPEGFSLSYEFHDGLTGIRMLNYEDVVRNRSFSFDYTYMYQDSTITWFDINDTARIEKVVINGMDGEYCPANGTDDFNGLLWFDLSYRIVFSLDGNIPKDVMLHIAQEIKPEESTN